MITPLMLAYPEAEISYDYLPFALPIEGAVSDEPYWARVQRATVVTCLFYPESKIRNVKIILRPIWSITEEEFLELAKLLGMSDDENQVLFYENRKVLQENELGHIGLEISKDLGLRFDCDKLEYWVVALNYLRSIHICVDQSLIDAGLVEWKKN